VESIKWEDCSSGKPGQKTSPYLQNNPSKKSQRCDSSNRVPASQVQSSEFKPQYHQKKNKTKIRPNQRMLSKALALGSEEAGVQ
jgi:hypothetical protein